LDRAGSRRASRWRRVEQPGLVLGFVKSFERDHDGFKTRIAELTVVMSKHVGSRAALHIGSAFWDASLKGDGVDTALHDRSAHELGDQIRAFGGVELRPLERSEILIDVGWAPEFCPMCESVAQIRLRPQLSWGVRYDVADWMHLESGVRRRRGPRRQHGVRARQRRAHAVSVHARHAIRSSASSSPMPSRISRSMPRRFTTSGGVKYSETVLWWFTFVTRPSNDSA
jgi:hypothetical protein